MGRDPSPYSADINPCLFTIQSNDSGQPYQQVCKAPPDGRRGRPARHPKPPSTSSLLRHPIGWRPRRPARQRIGHHNIFRQARIFSVSVRRGRGGFVRVSEGEERGRAISCEASSFNQSTGHVLRDPGNVSARLHEGLPQLHGSHGGKFASDAVS